MKSIEKIREASIESYFVAECERRGGRTIKLPANLYVGVPDRLYMLPNHIGFAEVKRPKGGRLSVAQNWWKKRLTGLGLEWHLLHTKEAVDAFFAAHDDKFGDFNVTRIHKR